MSLDGSGNAVLGDVSVTGGSRSATIQFPDGGIALSPSDAITFTFLTLPLEQTGLTLSLQFEDNLNRKLKNSGEWITIPACRKAYIWNIAVPNEYEFVLTVTNPTLTCDGGTSNDGKVASFKRSTINPGTTVPVTWEIEGYYATEEDASNGTNRQSSISDVNADLFTSFTASSCNGSTGGESMTIVYNAGESHTTQTDLSESINATLRNAAPKGSAGSPFNLANPQNGSTTIVETANTYIVNGPGYYRIPLVMGNGYTNGTLNPTAYQQTNFVNYKGNSITSPWLKNQGGTPYIATVIWAEVNMIDGISVSGDWLNFHIDANKITQGCTVIAVKDSGGTIMWSWNIWATDYVPCNYPGGGTDDVKCKYDISNTVTFMPINLGWVYTKTSTELTYSETTSAWVRIRQSESGNCAIMKVTKPAGSINTTETTYGHSPYYQWGRKDALHPSTGKNSNFLSLATGSYTYDNTKKHSMAEAITNPDKYYGQYRGDNNWCSTTDNGWWCAGYTSTYISALPTIKTIYDPCPAGYAVPRSYSFYGFGISVTTTYGNWVGTGTVGSIFYSDYHSQTGTPIFFPSLGYRFGTNRELIDTNSGYYWTAFPLSSDSANCLYFTRTHANPNNNFARDVGLSVRPARIE